MVKKISQNELQAEIANGVSVIDFSATWCGPCKMLAPVLEQISEEFDGKINFLNIDVDDNEEVAVQYGITNIPALVVVKDGEKQEMQVGFQPKDSLVEVFKKYV